MKYPLLLLFILLTFRTEAQEENIEATVQEIETGMDLDKKQAIMGIRYTIPYHIYDSYIDSDRNEVFMILQTPRKKYSEDEDVRYKKGSHIALFDLNTRKFKWSKKLLSTNLYVTDSKVIETLEDGSYCFDKTDGKKQWEIKEHILYTYKNIGIARDKEKKLNGINLNSGRQIWKRKIKGGADNIEDIIPLNDSILLIISDGLQTVNIHDGEGWAHRLATHDIYISPAEVFGGIALAGLSSAIFGISVMPSVSTYNVNSHSQVLTIDNKIYFASKRTLLCYDYNGNTIWKKRLPADSMSASFIFPYRNNIIIINKGYFGQLNHSKEMGTPFWAAFDKNTGQQNTDFIGEEYSDYYDYQVNGDTLMIMSTGGTIYKYLITNGQKIYSKKITLDKKSTYNFSSGLDEYTATSDLSFQNLSAQYNSNYFIRNIDTGMLLYNTSFSSSSLIPNKLLWQSIASYKGYDLLYNIGTFSVLVRNNRRRANINATMDAVITRNILFDVDKDHFTITDLAELLKS